VSSRNDYSSTGAWMIASVIANRISEYALDAPPPSEEAICTAIDGSGQGTALGEYIGAAWDAAAEIVHDMFPQFRDPDLEYVSRCPACGDVIDYCQGHGEMGDPAGFAILTAHDDDDHSECDPDGCDEAGKAWEQHLAAEREAPKRRLEYLRQEIRAERISYGELAELADLVSFIAPGDVELLEWAGVPEEGVNR